MRLFSNNIGSKKAVTKTIRFFEGSLELPLNYTYVCNHWNRHRNRVSGRGIHTEQGPHGSALSAL